MVAPSRYGVELIEWINTAKKQIAALELAVGAGGGGGSNDLITQIETNTTRIAALEKSLGNIDNVLDAIIGDKS